MSIWVVGVIGVIGVIALSIQAETLTYSGDERSVSSPVIDDQGLRSTLHRALIKLAEQDGHVTGSALDKQLAAVQQNPVDVQPVSRTSGTQMNYDRDAHGVVMLGSVYKCGKCDKWHLGHQATGWILSEDGLMVTNSHVFEKNTSEVYGVLTLDGRFAEVVEVKSADKAADLAIFQVQGDGFTPLPVASGVRVGERVHVISHPDSRFFSYTSGNVSRIFKGHSHRGQPSATMMDITADFAKGSSGGPVLNDSGEVVGMVASTRTIFYRGNNPQKDKNGNLDKGPPQMVIKQCVSLHEIRALIESPLP